MGLSGNNSIGLELADSQMKMGKPNDQVRLMPNRQPIKSLPIRRGLACLLDAHKIWNLPAESIR
tara:strand:- start:433 stop:624 length:192 start_codon:yes stop_codon:yes gene_type:complete